MLCLENIYWNAPDGRPILKNLNLEVSTGKLVVITGPNGSGKTTLARIIAGIEKPISGKIYLDGEDITDLDVTQRAHKGISFAFQQPVRFKGITVRQLLNISAGEPLNDKQLCGILSKVGLCANDYLQREVNSTLSGGEIKRIEIATVLSRHTPLSVFDEPEAGIDLWSFKSLIGAFRQIHDELQGTMVIISHQERILRIADEIVLLADGSIQSKGSQSDMMSRVFSSGTVTPASCGKGDACNE